MSTEKETKMSVDQHQMSEDKNDSLESGSLETIQLDPILLKQTMRRFDMFLLPQIALIIIVAYLDRSNIGL